MGADQKQLEAWILGVRTLGWGGGRKVERERERQKHRERERERDRDGTGADDYMGCGNRLYYLRGGISASGGWHQSTGESELACFPLYVSFSPSWTDSSTKRMVDLTAKQNPREIAISIFSIHLCIQNSSEQLWGALRSSGFVQLLFASSPIVEILQETLCLKSWAYDSETLGFSANQFLLVWCFPCSHKVICWTGLLYCDRQSTPMLLLHHALCSCKIALLSVSLAPFCGETWLDPFWWWCSSLADEAMFCGMLFFFDLVAVAEEEKHETTRPHFGEDKRWCTYGSYPLDPTFCISGCKTMVKGLITLCQ